MSRVVEQDYFCILGQCSESEKPPDVLTPSGSILLGLTAGCADAPWLYSVLCKGNVQNSFSFSVFNLRGSSQF